MELFLQWTQLIYNISFIVFTFLLVLYTIKTYNNARKRPFRLTSRINYIFINGNDNINSVMLDILNYGDEVANEVAINLIVNHNPPINLDRINFIAAKENFEFYLRKRIDKKLILFNGKEFYLPDPLDYDYFVVDINNNIVTLTIHTI